MVGSFQFWGIFRVNHMLFKNERILSERLMDRFNNTELWILSSLWPCSAFQMFLSRSHSSSKESPICHCAGSYGSSWVKVLDYRAANLTFLAYIESNLLAMPSSSLIIWSPWLMMKFILVLYHPSVLWNLLQAAEENVLRVNWVDEFSPLLCFAWNDLHTAYARFQAPNIYVLFLHPQSPGFLSVFSDLR